MPNEKCSECEYNGTNCFSRYYKDFLEFGTVEWICPKCDASHIISDGNFTCEHCGFEYTCE